jgi:hydroxymethylglutaryl-CoA synthase
MELGIVGWGAYIPEYRISTKEIANVWGRDWNEIASSLGVIEKAVADRDEDAATMAVEAGKSAINRAGIEPDRINACFVGSESHPYAVKPTGTIVAEALGLSRELFCADYEFACKAGSAAIQTCWAFAAAGAINYGLAIGSDTAQASPGDALEYTAGAGAAAFVVGKHPVAVLEGTYSWTTDTPDFWRRDGRRYPSHGGRFTGEPAYFAHIFSAAHGLMEKLGLKINDFDLSVVHMPNAKFPQRVYSKLGIEKQKWLPGFVVDKIGNTYSASSLLGLCGLLDVAKPDQRILVVAYGSGAGADAFSFLITDRIVGLTEKAPRVSELIAKKRYIGYADYCRMRNLLVR